MNRPGKAGQRSRFRDGGHCRCNIMNDDDDDDRLTGTGIFFTHPLRILAGLYGLLWYKNISTIIMNTQAQFQLETAGRFFLFGLLRQVVITVDRRWMPLWGIYESFAFFNYRIRLIVGPPYESMNLLPHNALPRPFIQSNQAQLTIGKSAQVFEKPFFKQKRE